MLRSVLGRATAGIAVVAMALSFGACSSVSGEKLDGGASALPPMLVAPAELAGQTFEITKEQPLVVDIEDPSEVEAWDGDVENQAVALFSPGRDDGSAQFNPSFDAVASGTTEASVISPSGETLEFTVRVR